MGQTDLSHETVEVADRCSDEFVKARITRCE